ncbi:unnamed protein product [Sphenostylis stenocarpa]|uniref:Uncharacterized protein n=1 Tax=Sphenostylis stenocarpa TaxID=92480 RepID=A0AA86T452_9FABA|nr:unnamed protein product [Sphenostylis stenocarpa]
MDNVVRQRRFLSRDMLRSQVPHIPKFLMKPRYFRFRNSSILIFGHCHGVLDSLILLVTGEHKILAPFMMGPNVSREASIVLCL